MKNLKDEIIFYVCPVSWIEPLLFAIVITFLSIILNYHFFYFHIFLFLGSIVCLSLSYRKYAVLNNSSLSIYMEKEAPQIIVNYDQIEAVNAGTKKINGVFRIGGKLGGIPNCIKEISYVTISLNTPLGKQFNPADINEYEMDSEDKKIEIVENGSAIILYKPPKGGFRPFLDALSKTVIVSNADFFEYEKKNSKYIDSLIFLLSLSGITCMLYMCSKAF